MSRTAIDRGGRPAFRPGMLAARSAALTGIALALAAAANLLNPEPLPWVHNWDRHVEERARRSGVPLVDRRQAAAAAERGTLLLDVRPVADFDAGHVPGARPVPWRNREEYLAALGPRLTSGSRVIAYCSGPECEDALLLARELQASGFTNVYLYAGGWEDWLRGKGK